ncbi:MAG: ABC transporter permease [Candidatus Izimaplasma sp.]|nr:ABC transporter permease [Candidatus Izimaplasma bacterium]
MIMKWSRGFTSIDAARLTYRSYKNFLYMVFVTRNWGGIENYPGTLWEVVHSKIHITILINFYAYIYYTFWGFFFGITTALYKGKLYDKIVSFFTLVFGSIPIYISIIVLIYLLGYKYHLLDPIYTSVGEGFFTQLKGFIIPVISLSLMPIAKLTIFIRGEVIENLNADYLLLAKAKGLNKLQRLKRHILRHGMIVILPILTDTFVKVLGLSFFVEIVYQIPGIANLLYDVVLSSMGDANVVRFQVIVVVAIGLVYSSFAIFIGFLNDVTQMLFDPRIRIGTKKTG